MRIRGICRLQRATGRLLNRFRPNALILLYHRVSDMSSDPQLMCVSKQHFFEHLDILGKIAHPIGLLQLVKAIEEGTLQDRTVVVTFDDGYADNYYNTKPLLEKFEIPATVFVTAGRIDSTSEFWWDELDRILLSGSKLKNNRLELNINGKQYIWNFDQQHEQVCQGIRWNVLMECNDMSRRSAYRELANILRDLSNEEREQVLTQLRTWTGETSVGRKCNLPLSSYELKSLSMSGLVDIGAHTMTHPVLSSLDREIQRKEIEDSKRLLESILKRPVDSFSYPFGEIKDYGGDTIELVKNAGFRCACSNFPGLLTRKTGIFQLPR